MKKTQRRKRSGIKILAVLLIVAALSYCGFRLMEIRQAGRHAREVLETMYTLIPGLGSEGTGSTGQGRDPLATLSIDNIDIAGCIEVPAIDLIAPVTAKGHEEDGFASIESGSPVKGEFKLRGNRGDVFRKLADAKPGDTVTFTDVDGVRYSYRVITQYHLKSWDEADNDLMLCYQTDDQTEFVLGCVRD